MRNAASISDLEIVANVSLSTCEVKSICDFLASPNGTIEIANNASGCNSKQEIEAACLVSAGVNCHNDILFTVSPNPIQTSALIKFNLNQPTPVTFKIIDLRGRVVLTLIDRLHASGELSIVFDATQLKPGIYFCTLQTNLPAGGQTRKIVKL